MPKRINPALRLYLVLQQGAELPENAATLKAWATLFHMEEPYGVKLSIDVSERLLWLNQELEMLEAQLRNSQIDEESWAAELRHIEQALSPVYLATNWDSVKQFLSADMLNSLESWNEILPETETSIKQEELEAILGQTQELENVLDSTTMPQELQLFISQHLKLIRKAVARYRIVGVRALKEAAHSALGEMMDVEETIRANSDTPELRKLIDIWRKTNLLANGAITKDSLLKIDKSPWAYFSQMLFDSPNSPA